MLYTFLGTDYDVWHDEEIAMQDHMHNPIAVHVEIMGNIM